MRKRMRDEARGKISRNEFVDTGKVNTSASLGTTLASWQDVPFLHGRFSFSRRDFYCSSFERSIVERPIHVVNRETETPRRAAPRLECALPSRDDVSTGRGGKLHRYTFLYCPAPRRLQPRFSHLFLLDTYREYARGEGFSLARNRHLSADLIRGRSGIRTKTLRII